MGFFDAGEAVPELLQDHDRTNGLRNAAGICFDIQW
jgi:hypothetical protein